MTSRGTLKSTLTPLMLKTSKLIVFEVDHKETGIKLELVLAKILRLKFIRFSLQTGFKSTDEEHTFKFILLKLT